MMDDPDAKALALFIGALERYPAPVPSPVDGGPARYIPALDVAMTIYAERFQRTEEEEEIIKPAFAGAAPKVLERCQGLYGALVDALVDGGRPPPGVRTDYAALMHELGTLAAVFVGPPGGASAGPYAPLYTAACGMIRGLMEISPK